MPTDQIIALLIAEREKLTRAIDVLQGPTKRRGRPPKNPLAAVAPAPTPVPAKRRRRLSAAGRKAIADAARKRWAAIKAGKVPSPFAKRAKRKAA